jgi:SAM-dependent methyltransferase
MNPPYTDEYLAKYYSTYIQDEPEWDEPAVYCHHFYFSLIEKYVSPPGKLLDIGAGQGHLLLVAKERRWSPIGYDVDSVTTKKVSEKIGVEILCGDFIKINWGEQTFDLISMHHVLEHLKSPVPYLRIIHSALREKGIFFIVLPNIHSLSSLGKFYLEKLKIKCRRVGAYYDTSHHLWYYTPRSLKNLLSRFGFEVLYMRSGHQVRPNQSHLKRTWRRNVTERFLWKSTFLVIARKK